MHNASEQDSLSAKKVIAALMGPGLFVLAFDSAVEHFVGKGGVEEKAQLIPLIFGAVGGLALLAMAVRRLGARVLRVTLQLVGGLSAAVGLVGAVLHILPLLEDLKDETLTLGALEGAVGSAPPLIAPLAFTALGILLVALGSPRLLVLFRGSARPATGAAPIPMASARRKTG